MLNAPFHDLASAVRAVETMTASIMEVSYVDDVLMNPE
jgi:hypothetical protein